MTVLPYFFDDFGQRPRRLMDQHFGQALTPVEPLIVAALPLLTREYYIPWRHLAGAARNQGSSIKTDRDKFQINLNVHDFAPEELTVKTADGHIVVEGKHEERMDEHSYISRQFVRRYALPDSAPPESVESHLSFDGVLIITAFKKLPEAVQGERKVPITHTGPIRKEIKDQSNEQTAPIRKEIKDQSNEQTAPVRKDIKDQSNEQTGAIRKEIKDQSDKQTAPDCKQIKNQTNEQTGAIRKEIKDQSNELTGAIRKEIKDQSNEQTGAIHKEIKDQSNEQTAPVRKEIKDQSNEQTGAVLKEIRDQSNVTTGSVLKEIKYQSNEQTEAIRKDIKDQSNAYSTYRTRP